MDITGARWGLEGAEAILKLRALRRNNDLDNYWTWHLNHKNTNEPTKPATPTGSSRRQHDPQKSHTLLRDRLPC